MAVRVLYYSAPLSISRTTTQPASSVWRDDVTKVELPAFQLRFYLLRFFDNHLLRMRAPPPSALQLGCWI
ncbi:uncharacterized [Tachysurus ichikawai]